MSDSRKEVLNKCKSAIEKFKGHRDVSRLICLYEYQDLDFNYAILVLAMEDSEHNLARVYSLMGELTQIQYDLPSECRCAYGIQYETIVK